MQQIVYPWYGRVSGNELQQGDILRDCPVPIVDQIRVNQQDAVEVKVKTQNLIVMSQSCDLRLLNGGCKLTDVTFCPLMFRNELTNDPTYRDPGQWNEAAKGRHPRSHVLHQCELEGHAFDFALVALHRIVTLNEQVVRRFAESKPERVRLLPPYREQLSQAFARFFMRVGLPVDLPQFR